jgi:hypothetical protein
MRFFSNTRIALFMRAEGVYMKKLSAGAIKNLIIHGSASHHMWNTILSAQFTSIPTLDSMFTLFQIENMDIVAN